MSSSPRSTTTTSRTSPSQTPPSVPTDPSNSDDPSIPIIAVTAVIGGLIVLFVVARLIFVLHKRRTQRSRPLPPARPLSMVESSWNGSAVNRAPIGLNPNHLESRPSFSGYRSSDPLLSATRPSFGKDGSRDSSPMRQPATPETPDFHDGQPLAPPNPAFFAASSANSPSGSLSGASSRTNSFTSIASAASDSDNGIYRPPRPNSIADFSPPRSARSRQQHRHSLIVPPSGSSPSRGSYYRARPVSSASLSSIRSGEAIGRRSIPTIRGAPHRPHSRVEIILPAPLAPHLSPYSGDDRDSLFTKEASDGLGSRRQSMVSISDPWMVVGRAPSSSSASTPRSKAEKSRRRQSRTSDSDHRPASQSRLSRPSLSSVSSHGGESSSSAIFASTASATGPPPPPAKTHADRLRIPQVPQIPQRLVASPTAQSPLSSELASMEDGTTESADTKATSEIAEKRMDVAVQGSNPSVEGSDELLASNTKDTESS